MLKLPTYSIEYGEVNEFEIAPVPGTNLLVLDTYRLNATDTTNTDTWNNAPVQIDPRQARKIAWTLLKWAAKQILRKNPKLNNRLHDDWEV